MNKIGWCNLTFNTVWGCRNNCPYCYARGIAKRFVKPVAEKEIAHLYGLCIDEKTSLDLCEKLKNDIKEFKPTFMYCQFDKKLPKKPQRIFVGSMSEIRFWKREWLLKVFKKIERRPEHVFQFLTKFPYIYHRLEFPAKSWLGFTATTNKDLANGVPHIEKLRLSSLTGKYLYFVSIEPILEKIDIGNIDDLEPNWIIVGAETGKRKGKIIPKKEWIEIIVDFCNRTGVPLYLKDSLKDIYPREIKEFPKIN